MTHDYNDKYVDYKGHYYFLLGNGLSMRVNMVSYRVNNMLFYFKKWKKLFIFLF